MSNPANIRRQLARLSRCSLLQTKYSLILRPFFLGCVLDASIAFIPSYLSISPLKCGGQMWSIRRALQWNNYFPRSGHRTSLLITQIYVSIFGGQITQLAQGKPEPTIQNISYASQHVSATEMTSTIFTSSSKLLIKLLNGKRPKAGTRGIFPSPSWHIDIHPPVL